MPEWINTREFIYFNEGHWILACKYATGRGEIARTLRYRGSLKEQWNLDFLYFLALGLHNFWSILVPPYSGRH